MGLEKKIKSKVCKIRDTTIIANGITRKISEIHDKDVELCQNATMLTIDISSGYGIVR